MSIGPPAELTPNTSKSQSRHSGKVSYVAVDWGTTSFRLWSLGADGELLDRTSGPYGMSGLAKDAFGPVLEKKMSRLGLSNKVPAVICGMAGAKQGWHEAPYLSAPTPLDQLGIRAARVPGISRDVRILPGVMQADPPEVMRGEETQVLGFLSAQPDFEGVVCLPGTHTKWVRVEDGKIAKFTTCMTGEVFSLLSKRSVLKHSLQGDGWDDDAFHEAVGSSIARPESLADKIFGIRAGMLLADLSSDTARARLSGTLIGIELCAVHSYWSDVRVSLIGESSLCRLYSDALKVNGAATERLNSETMTLDGFAAAIGQMKGS